MKFRGFLTNIDKNIIGHSFDQLLSNERIQASEKRAFIQYLKNGIRIADSPTYLRDEIDGAAIGGTSYYTDGEYIWPNYYVYYLNKYPGVIIDLDFYEQAKQNNFFIAQLGPDVLKQIESIFIDQWCGNRR